MANFFVSYVYEDRDFLVQIMDWHRRGLLGHWKPIYENEDVRPGGWRAVQRYLSPLIRQCNAMVLLVGNDTHNHDAVAYEVQNARSAGIPVTALRLPNTTGAPPASVGRNLARFRPADLLAALNGLA